MSADSECPRCARGRGCNECGCREFYDKLAGLPSQHEGGEAAYDDLLSVGHTCPRFAVLRACVLFCTAVHASSAMYARVYSRKVVPWARRRVLQALVCRARKFPKVEPNRLRKIILRSTPRLPTELARWLHSWA
jgi:hypothetical protein